VLEALPVLEHLLGWLGHISKLLPGWLSSNSELPPGYLGPVGGSQAAGGPGR